MQGAILGLLDLNSWTFFIKSSSLEVERGFSLVASRVFSFVFWNVGWFQLELLCISTKVP